MVAEERPRQAQEARKGVAFFSKLANNLIPFRLHWDSEDKVNISFAEMLVRKGFIG
jgi:hypothetical protein